MATRIPFRKNYIALQPGKNNNNKNNKKRVADLMSLLFLTQFISCFSVL